MRARGANARLRAKFETTVGVPPSGNYRELPFVSSNIGAEQGLEEDDTLGHGRESSDPVLGVVTNDGDVVVPVDARNFGFWLKLLLGYQATTGTAETGYTHVFTSGADALPSASIEVGMPEVPSFGMNRGVRANTLRIAMSRRGLLNATIGLIALGEDIAAASGAGNPTVLDMERFAQATGSIELDGAPLASVVDADFSFTNNLDKVETIQPSGEIEDADPGTSRASGSVTVRFGSLALLDKATGRDPIALSFGWEFEGRSLIFAMPRVFLPKPKRPVAGPNGIQVQFAWQASGQGGHSLTATLKNDVANYN